MDNTNKPKKRKSTSGSKKSTSGSKKSERAIVARELFPPEFCHFGSITPLASTDQGNPAIPRIPLLIDTINRKRQLCQQEQENVPRKISARVETQTRESTASTSTGDYEDNIVGETAEVAASSSSEAMKLATRPIRVRAPSIASALQVWGTHVEPGFDSKSYSALASSYAALTTAMSSQAEPMPPPPGSRGSLEEKPSASRASTVDAQSSSSHLSVTTTTVTQTQSQEDVSAKSAEQQE